MDTPVIDERARFCPWFRVQSAEPLVAIRCNHAPDHEGGHQDPEGTADGLWVRQLVQQNAAGEPWGRRVADIKATTGGP